MAKMSINLSFPRKAEEAFNFYKSIFGGEFSRGGISRYKDMPMEARMAPLAKEDEELIMHVELPIFKDFLLMGADTPENS
jgi:PhnB protein